MSGGTQKSLTAVLAASGLGSAIGVASDLAKPIAPVSDVVTPISIVLVLFLFLVRARIGSWFSPLVILVGSTAIIGGFSIVSRSWDASSSRDGFLASNFELGRELQEVMVVNRQDIQALNDELVRNANASEKTQKSVETLKRETSDNPRKELANMGIPWRLSEFIISVESGDTIAVELFLEGGMQLPGDDARDWVKMTGLKGKNYFDPEVAELLLDKNAILENAFCPEELARGQTRLVDEEIEFHDERLSVYVAVCGKQKLLSIFDEVIAEQARLDAEQTSANKSRDSSVKDCITSFNKTANRYAIQNQAANISMLDRSQMQYDLPLGVVLERLNLLYLTSYDGAFGTEAKFKKEREVFDAAVIEGCERLYPSYSTKAPYLERLRSARRELSKL